MGGGQLCGAESEEQVWISSEEDFSVRYNPYRLSQLVQTNINTSRASNTFAKTPVTLEP